MLSLSGKHWILPATEVPLSASQILAGLRRARGVDTVCTVASPAVYTDMARAVQRIRTAVAQGERIGIFGDYDCDGVTATAQLLRYCRRHGREPYVRLPHRVHDGYGLTMQIAEEIASADVSLLLTCDTGITAIDEVQWLKDRGIDVIVTDHHHPQEELPPATAIIHPVCSTHPLPHPSGSGVVFSVIRALEETQWAGIEEDMALAMMGTVADLVELKGSNRALTIAGLHALSQITSGPLHQLREQCSNTMLTAGDIAFRIAPRINAAGRMASPDIALEALLTGGNALAALQTLNEQRQEQTRIHMEQALMQCDGTNLLQMSVSDTYPHGIIGLIAGRLTETYGRPSLVAVQDGSTCTASLRSPSSYNIAEGLCRCSDLLLSYGGHSQAAGCTFVTENTDALRSRLTEDIRIHTDAKTLVPTLTIDALLHPEEITLPLCTQLAELEPYGQGNPEPLFLLRNVQLDDVRSCGSDGTHLQARIGGIKCIGFGMAHLASASSAFDVVARIGIDRWNDNAVPQLFVQDLQVAVSKKSPSDSLASSVSSDSF